MSDLRKDPVFVLAAVVFAALALIHVGAPLNQWMSTPAGQDALGRGLTKAVVMTLFRGHSI